MIRRTFATACLLAFAALPVSALQADDTGVKVDGTIGQKLASATNVSPQLLRQIQQSEAAMKSIVLVDVRADTETKVSIIPGAITKDKYLKNQKDYAGKTVVVYCLSGVRSADFVRKLKSSKIPAVDLKGSILGWCREGLPLTTLDGQPTNRVYTYDPDNKVPPQYQPVY